MTTVRINLIGCGLLAVVVVAAARMRPRRAQLLRPLLGTGLIGGFTTFSTFTLDVQRLLFHGQVVLVAGYLAATVLGGAMVTWACLLAARWLLEGTN